MAAVDTESIQNDLPPRRRRRKGRFIKQGYHRSEREDARRVAARAFLSGITLDSHLQQFHRSRENSPTPVAGEQGNKLTEDSCLPDGPSAASLRPITPPRRLHELLLDTSSLHYSPYKIYPSKSHDNSLNSPVSAKPFDIGHSASYIESVVGENLGWAVLSAVPERRQHGRVGSLGGSGPESAGLFVHHIPSLHSGYVTGNNRLQSSRDMDCVCVCVTCGTQQ